MTSFYVKHGKYRSARSIEADRRLHAGIAPLPTTVERTPRRPLSKGASMQTALAIYNPLFAAINAYVPPPIDTKRESVEVTRPAPIPPASRAPGERSLSAINDMLRHVAKLKAYSIKSDLITYPDYGARLLVSIQAARATLDALEPVVEKMIPGEPVNAPTAILEQTS